MEESLSVTCLLLVTLFPLTCFPSASQAATLVISGGTVIAKQIGFDKDGNVVFSGSSVSVDGAQISADRNIRVEANEFVEKNHAKLETTKGDLSVRAEKQVYLKDSELAADGNLDVNTGGTLVADSSKLTAKDGDVNLSGHDIVMPSSRETRETKQIESKSGFLGISKRKSIHEEKHDTADPTSIEAGGSVHLHADETIATEGTTIKAGRGITFDAHQWINAATQDQHCVSDEVKRSNLLANSHRVSGHCRTGTVHTRLDPGEGPVVLNVNAVEAMVGLERDQSLEQALDQLVKRYPDLSWIAMLRDRKNVQWHTIRNTYQDWRHKSSGVSPLLAIVITTAVTVATQGIGASFLPATMTGNIISTNAANAAFSSLVAKSAVDLANNNGNIGATLDHLFSEDTVRDVAVDVIGAGIAGVTKTPYRISMEAPLAQRIQEYGARVASHTGAAFTAKGGSLRDHFADSLSSEAWQEVGAQASYWAGDYAQQHGWEEGSAQKVALHASVGAVLGKLKNGEPLAGALAAGSAQAVAGLTEDQSLKVQEATATIVSAIAANVAGGDPQTGAWIGQTQHQYNRQLHLEEAEFLQDQLENKDEDERARFIAAMCAEVHCSEEIGRDDPDYATFAKLEQAGQEYMAEREVLKSSGLFKYNTLDKVDDLLHQYDKGITRFSGIIKAASGVLSAAGSFTSGILLCSTGVGCGIGAAIAGTGSTLGYEAYKEGVEEVASEYQPYQADRVAASFHPDTHPGDRSRLEELLRSAVIATAESAVERLGRKLMMKVSVPVKSSATRTSTRVPKLGKEVWSLDPLVRGRNIESYLTVTDYKDWQRADDFINPATGKRFKSNNFPLIDFQLNDKVLSLKTVDTKGKTWDTRIRKHIDDLYKTGITVASVPARKYLDVRVQPGGYDSAKHLIEYGKAKNVHVFVKEFGN